MSTDAHARALHTIALMCATIAASTKTQGENDDGLWTFDPYSEPGSMVIAECAATLYEAALCEVNEKLPGWLADTHVPSDPAPRTLRATEQILHGNEDPNPLNPRIT